jgi:hypothetical protein
VTVVPRLDDNADLATLEAAYRKARFTIIGHGVFFFVCCVIAVLARRMLKMPPALLTVVFIVALLLFGGDVLRFLSYRRRIRRLRDALP